jgi:hypothetical protein
MYNVTMRHISEITVAMEKQYFMCMRVHACMKVPKCMGMSMHVRACSLAYPASNAYAPYCDVICGPSVSTFFNIISIGAIFRKKVTEHKCVF